jgi:hypothetical protein
VTVYLVEQGEYSARYVMFVADSLDTAAHAIRAAFPPPYIVAWEPVKVDGERSWNLVGHFTAVPNLSMQHTAIFDIAALDVITAQ